MTASVVVLGSANMDLVVRQPRRVERGETIFGTSFRTGPGGKGLNQAVAAARAGAAVTFIGAVGADDFGARLREWLAGEGIDVSLLRTTESPSGIAQITVTDDGENAIVVVPGANSVDDLTVADREAIASAAFLVVQLERPESLVREALTHAHAHGVTTVLTPAPARTGIEDFVALADILVANEGEAALLSGEPDAEAAAVALSRTARTVVVTRGSRGALVASRGAIAARVTARAVTTVDTTGAGDTFTGALVAWLASGAQLADALDAATTAAAIAVTREGAAESMPALAEIVSALRDD